MFLRVSLYPLPVCVMSPDFATNSLISVSFDNNVADALHVAGNVTLLFFYLIVKEDDSCMTVSGDKEAFDCDLWLGAVWDFSFFFFLFPLSFFFLFNAF